MTSTDERQDATSTASREAYLAGEYDRLHPKTETTKEQA